MTGSRLWPARAFIYARFAATARAPSAADLAQHFGLALDEAEGLLRAQVWELSKLWYHHRLSPDYPGRTPQQVAAVFQQVGLTAPFWSASA